MLEHWSQNIPQRNANNEKTNSKMQFHGLFLTRVANSKSTERYLEGRTSFIGTSIAADIRIRQIAVVRTITTVISVICSILIASGMISSTATIGCENNAD
jgi:hypothetical protein